MLLAFIFWGAGLYAARANKRAAELGGSSQREGGDHGSEDDADGEGSSGVISEMLEPMLERLKRTDYLIRALQELAGEVDIPETKVRGSPDS